MRASHVLPWRTVAALALAGTALTACERQAGNAAVENVAQAEPPQRPALPVAEPPLDREALLLAVIRAASAHATGTDDGERQRKLDGRQFEIRIRLGCQGEQAGAASPSVEFDEDTRRLRIRAVPNLSLEDPVVRQLAGESVEAVEGFWLQRPWMLTPACPRAPMPAPDAQIAPVEKAAKGNARSKAEPERAREAEEPAQPAVRAMRIGIAQLFTEADDRTRRRSGRPYETTQTLAEGQQPGGTGFNLVLSGRVRARGGPAIRCAGGGADAPPDCIVSSDIDRVWIERPEDRTVVAEWRS